MSDEQDRKAYQEQAMNGGAYKGNKYINDMYDGYNPFSHAKYRVLSRELDLYKPSDMTIMVGAPSRSYTKYASQTLGSTSQSNFIIQTTLQTLLSSYVPIHYSLFFNFPPNYRPLKSVVEESLRLNAGLFLAAFPLQACTQTFTFSFGGTAITAQLSQLLPMLLRCSPSLKNNKYISSVPSTPDTRSTYYDLSALRTSGLGGLNNPNNASSFLPKDGIARNITDFDYGLLSSVNDSTNTLCAGIVINLYEPMVLDPFSLTREGKPCLNGVNNYQWTFTYQSYNPGQSLNTGTGINNGAPLSRAFRIANGATCPANSPAYITDYNYLTWNNVVNGLSGDSQAVINFNGILGVNSLPTGFEQIQYPELTPVQYSQCQDFPLFDNYSYPYSDLSSGFIAQSCNVNTVVVPAPDPTTGVPNRGKMVNLSNSNVNLLQIPKYFIFWVTTMESAKDISCADWVMNPLGIAVQFQTTQSLLSTARSNELRQLSFKNGWEASYATQNNVGMYLILASSDLGIPNNLMVEGVINSFQFQVLDFNAITPLNLPPGTYQNLQLYQVAAYSSEIQISNNRANLVCVANILPSTVESFKYVDPDNMQSASVNNMQGGSIHGMIKSHSAKIKGMLSHMRDGAHHAPMGGARHHGKSAVYR